MRSVRILARSGCVPYAYVGAPDVHSKLLKEVHPIIDAVVIPLLLASIIGCVVPLIGNTRLLVDVTGLLIGGGVNGAILLVSHSSPLIGGVVLPVGVSSLLIGSVVIQLS